jgi:hypothetical protein
MATTTVDFEKQLVELGLGEGWKWDKGSWWLEPAEPIDVRAVTQKMISLEARFVAITATERPDHEICLDYQWDLSGNLLSFVAATAEKKIASIVDLMPGADWVERETYEYFAVEFTGRASLEPLMMRVGQPVGMNLHKEEAAQ